jgi:glutamine amidotransferase
LIGPHHRAADCDRLWYYACFQVSFTLPIPTRRVGVIDLAIGNIGSVLRMLGRIGVDAFICSKPEEIDDMSPIVLPGVGHFSRAVKGLHDGRWRGRLNELYAEDRPILGICLGAQLLCQSSEEGPGSGLGWVPATVRRFPKLSTDGKALCVPHMGWQPFTPPPSCLPFVCKPGRMYYAHSFYIEPSADGTLYPFLSAYGGVRFGSVVRARRAIGVQFHPEKSHRHGMAFLRSWLDWASREGP